MPHNVGLGNCLFELAWGTLRGWEDNDLPDDEQPLLSLFRAYLASSWFEESSVKENGANREVQSLEEMNFQPVLQPSCVDAIGSAKYRFIWAATNNQAITTSLNERLQ